MWHPWGVPDRHGWCWQLGLFEVRGARDLDTMRDTWWCQACVRGLGHCGVQRGVWSPVPLGRGCAEVSPDHVGLHETVYGFWQQGLHQVTHHNPMKTSTSAYWYTNQNLETSIKESLFTKTNMGKKLSRFRDSGKHMEDPCFFFRWFVLSFVCWLIPGEMDL